LIGKILNIASAESSEYPNKGRADKSFNEFFAAFQQSIEHYGESMNSSTNRAPVIAIAQCHQSVPASRVPDARRGTR
jgi:hypothetical protein